jgi:outer membrane lipoprotein-sorting protein
MSRVRRQTWKKHDVLKTVLVGAACAISIVSCWHAVYGQSGPSSGPGNATRTIRHGNYPNLQPEAGRLLRSMLSAESNLSLSGEQTTILFRSNGSEVQSTQTIYRNGADSYRCEFHSPPRLAGEIIVSHGDMSWRYNPAKKELKISAPHPRHLMTQIGPALKALKSGAAQAAVVGSDVVAGVTTQIVAISGTGSTPSASIRIWIDPATGAQLKTEVYDASGSLQSSSFFTSIAYNPTFPPNAFDAPTVPSDTKTDVEQHYSQLNRLPSDAEAGFHVLKPKFLPAGYQFVSASVFQIAGRKAVALRFQGDLTLMSIFESPQDPDQPMSDRTSSPRAGTIVVDRNGMQFAAMGTLDNQTMLSVLQSLK